MTSTQANHVKLHKGKQFLKGHEEELFLYYYETMGDARSYQKLQGYCVTQGWINPDKKRKNRVPGRMALWFAIWRWAIRPENQTQAYEVYQKVEMDDGRFCTLAEWQALLEERAAVCLRDNDFERWKSQNVSVS